MAEIGCYTLHLYCDDPRHAERLTLVSEEFPFGRAGTSFDGPGEFTGRDLAGARRDAKKSNWHWLRERQDPDRGHMGVGRKTICPMCWELNQLSFNREVK